MNKDGTFESKKYKNARWVSINQTKSVKRSKI